MKKKLSKTAQKRELQKLNRQIHVNAEQRELNKERKIIDDSESKLINDLQNSKTLMDDFDTQLSSNEPERELVTGKNIKFKTELNEEQRCAISILYDSYMEFLERWNIDITALKRVLDEYVDFGASLGRKSRTEFVTARQATAQQNQLQNQNNMQSQISNIKTK